MWVRILAGGNGLLNYNQIINLSVSHENPSGWFVQASVVTTTTTFRVSGFYSTEAEAVAQRNVIAAGRAD